MRSYRDKFIAHLDDRPVMNIPQMSVAETSTFYFYDTIRAEHTPDVFEGLPTNLRRYAQRCRVQAKSVYANAAEFSVIQSNILYKNISHDKD
jgi:hypothetical protein